MRRIRAGEEDAWRECIEEYEGRLQAFVISRLRDRALAEDLVQDTFLGFLTALPNYNDDTPIESFLFAIAAHKITDTLRKQGRRPTLPLNAPDGSEPGTDPVARHRMASSIARSRERMGTEERVIADCLVELVRQWKSNQEFERLKVAELLFVKGFPNKQVAEVLAITEQAVANHKYFIVNKLKDAAKKSLPPDANLKQLGLET